MTTPSPQEGMSTLDAAFLYYDNPNQRPYVGCVAVLDGPVPFPAFAAMQEARLTTLARYRQRAVRPALDLGWPHWEEDPDFDIRRHVRHLAAPPPGRETELREIVDTLFSTPLDRRHPLWETYLIDGLAGGRAALLCKVHHAMIDGVSGAQVLELMTDPSPTGEAAAPGTRPRPAPVGGRDGRGRRALGALVGLADAVRSAASPDAVRARAHDALTVGSILTSFVREPAPRLPWNGPLSDARRVVWAGFPLDDFLALRGAAGCKVNDIVLAVITGGLRRYLEGRGVRLDGLRARALTPVNLRQDSEHLALGNRVSAMFPWLPLGVADPRERLQRICEEMRALKERGDAQGGVLVMGLMGLMPAPLGALMGRLSPERVLLNTVCTNVAGPRTVRFLLGRRVLEVHPIVPLFFGMGLEFAIMSYAGRLSIGVTADPHLVPDADAIADGLTAAAAELRAALGGTVLAPAPTPAGPRVADLMSRQVTAASPQDTLADAYLVMRVQRIRHLPVVDEGAHLLGLVTHRDLLAASSSTLVVPSEEDRIELLARAQLFTVMETHLATAAPGEDAAEAGRRMIRHKIGCLPVVEDGRLVGIVTEEDFLRWATDHMGGAAG